jgi:hypothetical protein
VVNDYDFCLLLGEVDFERDLPREVVAAAPYFFEAFRYSAYKLFTYFLVTASSLAPTLVPSF